MNTIVVVAIAIALGMGILAAVFVVGGMYQQELFEEYVEDSQTSKKRDSPNIDLPSFDVP